MRPMMGVAKVAYAPGLFTFDGKSLGAFHTTDGAPVTASRPAAPGEAIVFFGTGFGVSEPVYQAGEIIPAKTVPLRDPVTIMIAGQALAAADVLYTGLVPGAISGAEQFNVRVPMSAASGELPVMVQIGGAQSQSGVTLPVQQAQ